jgi:hypothetical protein
MSKASMTKKELLGIEKTKHYKNLEKLCSYYGINKKGYELYEIFKKYEDKIIKQTTNSCNGKGTINGIAYHTGLLPEDEKDLNNHYVKQGYKSALLSADNEDDLFGLEAIRLKTELQNLFPSLPFHINYDARGYALKIDNSIMKELFDKGIRLYSDFGGYGILAPEFEESEEE